MALHPRVFGMYPFFTVAWLPCPWCYVNGDLALSGDGILLPRGFTTLFPWEERVFPGAARLLLAVAVDVN